MARCLICLGEVRGRDEYHPRCLTRLFGTPRLPRFGYDLANLNKLAIEMVGKMSISGVQEKVSLVVSEDKESLQIAGSGGRYILKPPPQGFPSLPENEHLSMRLAEIAGIDAPPFGLLRLKDQRLAYIIKRFDRLDEGGKLAMEDFCQLTGTSPKEKYDIGSAELCVRTIRQYASEPLIDLRRLFQFFLFNWCIGNGDLHLKNLSLLTTPDGIRRLSPAYDILNTNLVLESDGLAISIGGKKNNLTRNTWLNFGTYCDLPERVVHQLMNDLVDAEQKMQELIARSLLPPELQDEYAKLLSERIALLVSNR